MKHNLKITTGHCLRLEKNHYVITDRDGKKIARLKKNESVEKIIKGDIALKIFALIYCIVLLSWWFYSLIKFWLFGD